MAVILAALEQVNHSCKKTFFTCWLKKRRKANNWKLNAFILDTKDSKMNCTQSARHATPWATRFNECGKQINDICIRDDGKIVLLRP